MARTKHLTPQQQRFVEAYVTGKSAADAAAEAGYRAENRHLLRVNAARVLATPRVRAEIDKRLVVVAKRTGVTAERAVRELETLAMSCVDNYVVGDDGRLGLRDGAPKNALKAVQRFKYRLIPRAEGPPIVEVEIALWDKLGALKTLGRHLGVFLPQVKEPDGADKVLDLFHEMLKARNERMREDEARVVVHEIEAAPR